MDEIIVEPQVTTLDVTAVEQTVIVEPSTTSLTVTDDGVTLNVETTPTTLIVEPQQITLNIEPQVTTLVPSTGTINIYESGGGGNQVSWFNGHASGIGLGQVVYLSGDDIVNLAKADSDTSADAVGLVADTSIPNGMQGNVQISGVLGGLSGLSFGVYYYLSDTTAGALTATPPSTTGHFIVEVGVGVSTTELLIRPRLLVAL